MFLYIFIIFDFLLTAGSIPGQNHLGYLVDKVGQNVSSEDFSTSSLLSFYQFFLHTYYSSTASAIESYEMTALFKRTLL